MYQFHMSVDAGNAGWFAAVENCLSVKIKGLGGVVAYKAGRKRTDISIACESEKKAEAVSVIRETLSEMYLTVCKYKYLQDRLRISGISDESLEILLHTLVAFDRETEGEILAGRLLFGDSLSLDGFFNFKLGELRARWDEIVSLAGGNALYLSNEKTLNELLRFLLSAVAPRIRSIKVWESCGQYSVAGEYQNSAFEFRTASPHQLLIYLINIAPVELVLDGEFDDDRLYRRIIGIFDGKSVQGTL